MGESRRDQYVDVRVWRERVLGPAADRMRVRVLRRWDCRSGVLNVLLPVW